MAKSNDFECLRCAACCRNLLENKDGILRGLPLTKQEVSLFPKELVSPKLGIGIRAPDIIILYQLSVNCCPNISDHNACQIYTKRPFMCQSFPIVAGAISNRCRVFSYRRVGVNYDEPYTMEVQLEASAKLDAYLNKTVKKHATKGLKFWEYDLALKQWILRG